MASPDTPSALKGELLQRAAAFGFVRVGVAVAQALEPEGERLRAFVAAGRHGSMSWLADTVEVRADPRHPGMLPEAVRVVVLVAPYARSAERVGPAPGRIARYARGRDYHNALKKPLRRLEAMLREAGHATRYSVDSRPVYERAWAQRAGVGFIGKNCCLIVPGLGSHVFLATLVTSAPLPPDTPMPQRCGRCRLCLDACPTGAFLGARELDARRCISYLTIEHREPIAPELEASMGDWLLGCDVCQDVCPYNATSPPPAATTRAYAPDPRWSGVDASQLLEMDEDAFDRFASSSPFKRPGAAAMARNAAIVLGNRGDRRHLPVLQHAAEAHREPLVRDAASRAAARLERKQE